MKYIAVENKCRIGVPTTDTVNNIAFNILSLGDTNTTIDGDGIYYDKIELLITSAVSSLLAGFTMIPNPTLGGYKYEILGSSNYTTNKGSSVVLEGDSVNISIPMINSSTGATATIVTSLMVNSAGQSKVQAE